MTLHPASCLADHAPLCLMPGCTNPADPGMKLCQECRGDALPVSAIKPPVPLTGLTADQVILAARKHKKKQTSWNRKPRVVLACPCGKRFSVPKGPQERRKYCSMACKKKYYQPNPTIHTKWPLPPGFDEELRRVYQEQVLMAACRAKHHPCRLLAEKYGIPRWKVSRRAVELCLTPTARKKDPPWSKDEIALLAQFAHYTPQSIQSKFREAGYRRSLNAIAVKLTRVGARQLTDVYTAREAASIFGVDQGGIRDWIDKGYLDASRSGTARTTIQGGDMWSITTEAMRAMIKHYPELVDFRKIDKYFFAQLL